MLNQKSEPGAATLGFEDFFRRATRSKRQPDRYPPYGYQTRLACGGLTAVILAWLWRLLYDPDPQATPRRLIFALPQRTLVEQVAGEVWPTSP